MQIQRIAQQPPNLSDCGMPQRNPLSTLSYAAEKSSAEITRFIKQVDLSSIEEANEILQAAMVYKNGFLLSERPPHIQELSEFDSESASANMREFWTQELEKDFPYIPELWSKAMNPESDLERAQVCMSDAWEALGEQRSELAKKALEISPDCADAYVLLAQESRTLEEAKILYEKAFEIGKRQLEACQKPVEYWRYHLTRPYLRARAGLAATLWQLGACTDAIDHLFEMLLEDKEDHVGIRYQHWHYLMHIRDFSELEGFLQADRENSATWHYTRALMLFLTAGTCPRTDQALRDAIKTNIHVPGLLLGEIPLPEIMPVYVSLGEPDEAVEYVAWSSKCWSREPEALEWLRKVRDQITERMKHPSFKVWQNSMKDADRASDANQFGKARGHLLYALRQCQRFPADQFLLETCQELSLVCTYLDASTQDEEIFQRPVKLAIELYGENSTELAIALNGQALYYLECKRLDEAEAALKRAESIACELELEDLQATVYTGLSRVFHKQGKIDLSREYLKKLEEIEEDEDEDELDIDHQALLSL